jgi:hypothetical protein
MKIRHAYISVLCLAVTLVLALVAPSFASETKGAASIERITPGEARTKVQAGKALLVCSYEDKKCKKILLEGAMLRSELEGRLPSLSKDQEIIFYCG